MTTPHRDLPRRLPWSVWAGDQSIGDPRYCAGCGHNVVLHDFASYPWPCTFRCDCPSLSHTLVDAYIVSWGETRERNRRKAIPASVRAEVIARDGLVCRYCGRRVHQRRKGPRRLHLDHVLPRSLGGGDTADNLVVSCALCNMRKHDNPLIAPTT